MSIGLNGAYPTRNTAGLNRRSILGGLPAVSTSTAWVRNPSWPACNAASGSNKIVGLYAVWPGDGTGNGGNFFAVTIQGAYTINYGDGTTTNYASGVTAYYEFNFNDVDLANTNAPVTFTDTGDLVTRASHGYTNGMIVRFYNIVSTTGLTPDTPYYVISATTNTFQISTTLGGSAVALTTNGSATLLPYKIATVTITPQAANNLTSVDFNAKHNQLDLQNSYSTGWLDIAVAGASISTLIIGSAAPTVYHDYAERVAINQIGGSPNTFSGVFQNMTSLRSVIIGATTTAITNTTNMFNGCTSLTTVPLFDTSAVTNMGAMFNGCSSLITVPFFNTAAVTSMSDMFLGCSKLTTVPLFNTAAVTNMQSMFQNCRSLTTVPLFNTILVNTMTNMFNGCTSLTTVPLFNTVAVTNMQGMFAGCTSLTTVPLFNTAAVTNMSGMFSNCQSLTTVPLFNTILVNTMATMFSTCQALTTVPLFNTVAVTNMQSMFADCYLLTTVPLFNTAIVTNMSFMFSNCRSLTSISLLNTVAVTNMSGMFSSCRSLASIPLLNTAAVTNMNQMFLDCRSLQSIPALVTTAVTSSANFSNMFTTCPSLARIRSANFRFTFSVASCKLSATALNEIYTNLPTVTSQTITVTGNYGTATDTPSIATAKGWTVTG